MGHHAAPRLLEFGYVGLCQYSITCCTFQRIAWFVNPSIVEEARTQLLRTMSDEGFGVTVYCFMPDHVHALLEGQREDSALKPAMNRWKQACGYGHRRVYEVP